MQYPEAPYSSLGPEDLSAEYEKNARELSAAHAELAEVKIQYNWLFLRGYKDSVATSVSGRERDGEIAAVAIKEDELRLEGEIGALTSIRDLLTLLLSVSTRSVASLS